MRRLMCLVVSAVLLAVGLSLAAPASAATSVHSVSAGHNLLPGQRLVSPHDRYRVYVRAVNGRLVLARSTGAWVWSTPATRRGAYLRVGPRGDLRLVSGSGSGATSRWRTNTVGSGRHNVLRVSDTGVLTLSAGGAAVWTNRLGNGCGGSRGKTFVADLSRQAGWMCAGTQLQRATYLTSGATAKGDATPRGTWHVQRRVRNTTLYPAAGGAYHVHYWVPYDGAYGVHDSPWQHFAYGSSRYKTQGSHGCIHLPAAVMAWFFGWARVGTTVRVHS
jgi:L,D-transpeptidase-like protein